MHHIRNLELHTTLYQPNPGQTSQIFIQKCPSLSCYIQSFLASKLILCYVTYVSHLRTNIASPCFRLNCKLDASADVLLSESSHGSQTPSDLAALYDYTSPTRGHITWPLLCRRRSKTEMKGTIKKLHPLLPLPVFFLGEVNNSTTMSASKMTNPLFS